MSILFIYLLYKEGTVGHSYLPHHPYSSHPQNFTRTALLVSPYFEPSKQLKQEINQINNIYNF